MNLNLFRKSAPARWANKKRGYVMERESLKRVTLNWFQEHAADVLGPSEINVHTDENIGRTTFTVTLKSSPPVVEGYLESRSLDYEVHENIRIYLDVIEDGFLELLVYLELKVDSSSFLGACELANYVNSNSSTGFVQVFDERDGLIVRVKVASSASRTPSDEDFNHLFFSSFSVAYQAFDLFYLFSSTGLDPRSVIDLFESMSAGDSCLNSDQEEDPKSDESKGEDLKRDKEIRYKLAQISNEFKNIVSGLEDADYWEEKLDYSIDSFQFFDQLVEDLWPEEPPTEKNIEKVVAVFGSYIAQTLMYAFEGTWSVSSDGAWEYTMAVSEDQPVIQVYPFVWMRKRFDEEDLIAEKYQSLVTYSEQITDSHFIGASSEQLVESHFISSPTGVGKRLIRIDELSDLLDLNVKGPGTDVNAEPTVVCNVINHRVVLIKEGSIRGARVANLFFLLADDRAHPRHDAHQRLAVKCYWYNWKPKTSWMGILVKEGAYEIIENYTGEVVVNFGRG